MGRISSAGYVTAVLHFLQAYNADDLDACEQLLDQNVEWHSAVSYTGRPEVRRMLETLRKRWTQPQARPDDFRESGGHVLMVVLFHEGDPKAPRQEQRHSWILDMNDEGLIRRVVAYDTPAEAARALEALAPKVQA
jgi:ketosteroid isomerase-like protein